MTDFADQPRGCLYLVPNTLDLGCVGGEGQPPVPDLGSVLPLGVLQTAARLKHWICENAKTTRAFLKRVNDTAPLRTPLQELDIQVLPRPGKGHQGHAKTQHQQEQAAIQALLGPALAGHDVGLISEAGLPGVADPGAAVVLAAHRAGITVIPLSGPSSIVLGLAASGLYGQSFAFLGYLPTEATQRSHRIKELEQLSRKARQTQLVIETPYRNNALWEALLSQLQPDTLLSVSCGLTLVNGFSRTDLVGQWRKQALTLPNDIPAVFGWLAA
ncbi:MAG: SAM-dependent methyltransferase [Burkholderiales bacterium]|nr:SAM-dependent methyltransferase [Burkholderiales bacterium]MDE2431917.1 SAM-dependent methyltransferase [Burkholderiales bacterium]